MFRPEVYARVPAVIASLEASGRLEAVRSTLASSTGKNRIHRMQEVARLFDLSLRDAGAAFVAYNTYQI